MSDNRNRWVGRCPRPPGRAVPVLQVAPCRSGPLRAPSLQIERPAVAWRRAGVLQSVPSKRFVEGTAEGRTRCFPEWFGAVPADLARAPDLTAGLHPAGAIILPRREASLEMLGFPPSEPPGLLAPHSRGLFSWVKKALPQGSDMIPVHVFV
jgi:hypothetical protein